MPINKPRILLYDLETTHNLVALFNLKNDNWIPPENIVQERYIVTASWKWLGEKQIHAVSVLDDLARYRKNPHDDWHVLQTLYALMQQADIIVAHNGVDYDSKFLAGRLLVQGFKPLPPIPQIDTLKTARSKFLLNANSLDYLGGLLKVGHKKITPKGLWLKVLQGDAGAIRQMVTYNKQDVLLLERVFKKLQPYIADVNLQLFSKNGNSHNCPHCGSPHTKSKGLYRAVTQVYQRRYCLDCGGWFRNRKAEKPAPTEVRVL